MASSAAFTASHAFQRLRVQPKGTPRRYPRKRGGSPSGVRSPPALATTKMKNTTTWALRRRTELARRRGRIRTIEAPVVPMNDARIAPHASRATFTPGVPASVPRTTMPPAMTKREPSRTMKARYSLAVCSNAPVSSSAVQTATGAPSTTLRRALLRFLSQNPPATNGSTAMARSIRAKGATLQAGKRWPSSEVEVTATTSGPCIRRTLAGAWRLLHRDGAGGGNLGTCQTWRSHRCRTLASKPGFTACGPGSW
jgi:hypothetical protein